MKLISPDVNFFLHLICLDANEDILKAYIALNQSRVYKETFILAIQIRTSVLIYDV